MGLPRNMRAALFAAALLSSGSAVAQVDWQLGGSADATFGVALDGSLPIAAAEVELRASGEIGSGLFPDASFTVALQGGYDAASGTVGVGVDVAHATLYLGEVDVTVGKQRVTWGSTDGVNPVDVLNPRDLSFPPGSDKLAVPMLYASIYAAEDFRVQAALVPVFTPPILPGPDWRAAPPAPPPGATIVGQLPPEDQLPEAELGNVQFGVRATALLGDFDVSATYFHGFRNQPTLSARLEPTNTPGQFLLQPVISFDRIDLFGLDFSGVVGDVVLRGEAAYTFTGDPDGVSPIIGNHSAQVVLGAEYLIPQGPRTVVQAIFDYGAPDAGEESDLNLKFMTGLAYQADARTQLDLGWMQNLDGSGAVLPTVSYTFADGVVGTASAYVFYGGDGTEFGGWRENSQLRVGLNYAF